METGVDACARCVDARPEQRAAEALSVLAEASEGAVGVDRDGRITWISPKYERLASNSTMP